MGPSMAEHPLKDVVTDSDGLELPGGTDRVKRFYLTLQSSSASHRGVERYDKYHHRKPFVKGVTGRPMFAEIALVQLL